MPQPGLPKQILFLSSKLIQNSERQSWACAYDVNVGIQAQMSPSITWKSWPQLHPEAVAYHCLVAKWNTYTRWRFAQFSHKLRPFDRKIGLKLAERNIMSSYSRALVWHRWWGSSEPSLLTWRSPRLRSQLIHQSYGFHWHRCHLACMISECIGPIAVLGELRSRWCIKRLNGKFQNPTEPLPP